MVSPSITPSPMPTMADISGATSMAPMITAGLLSNSPSAASSAASPIMV